MPAVVAFAEHAAAADASSFGDAHESAAVAWQPCAAVVGDPYQARVLPRVDVEFAEDTHMVRKHADPLAAVDSRMALRQLEGHQLVAVVVANLIDSSASGCYY